MNKIITLLLLLLVIVTGILALNYFGILNIGSIVENFTLGQCTPTQLKSDDILDLINGQSKLSSVITLRSADLYTYLNVAYLKGKNDK